MDFWVAAAFLLVSAAVASVEVGGGEGSALSANAGGGGGKEEDLPVPSDVLRLIGRACGWRIQAALKGVGS